jgi:hypothetical protein
MAGGYDAGVSRDAEKEGINGRLRAPHATRGLDGGALRCR